MNNTFSDTQYTFVRTKANVETQNITTIIGFQPNKYFLSAGLRYIGFGDAVAQDGRYFLPMEGISQIAEQADFKGNTAMVYGLKIGYKC
ncbi:hypothetical protein [Acinetobacter sp.]|uniref:hypothetical protein n=1 Tax=Acinetobacter sp. TaxID=472 RepID=UPI003340DB15